MNRTNTLVRAVASCFAVAAAAPAMAASLNFNFGGTTFSADAIDWAQTSFVAVGGNQAVANCVVAGQGNPVFVCGKADGTGTNQNSYNFHVLTQARVTEMTNATTGEVFNVPGQLTMIARFAETVTSVDLLETGEATANFAVVPGGTHWVEWYWDDPAAPSTGANQLTGFGFNDGKLILRSP